MIDFTDQTDEQLIRALERQCAGGNGTTYCETTCGPGHWGRGRGACADCLDAELLRRGIDVTAGGNPHLRHAYERVAGEGIRRKVKGQNPQKV